jgi:hypothetical protein
MKIFTRAVAALQLALILPAVVFLTAILVAMGNAPQYDLAHVSQHIVLWYSARMWTLWFLLLGLPFTVLVLGCLTLLGNWKHDVEMLGVARPSLVMIQAPMATFVVAGTTAS